MNKKKIAIVILSSFIVLVSCNIDKTDSYNNEKDYDWLIWFESHFFNGLLIRSENVFVMGLSDSAMKYCRNASDPINKYVKPYTSARYVADTIITTTLHEINGHGKTVGKIRINGDTITLLTKHYGGGCKCVELHQFTYYISNRNNKEYVIIY